MADNKGMEKSTKTQRFKSIAVRRVHSRWSGRTINVKHTVIHHASDFETARERAQAELDGPAVESIDTEAWALPGE